MDLIFHKYCINLDEENIDKNLEKYRYSIVNGKYGLHTYFQYGGSNEKYLNDPSVYLLDNKNNCVGNYLKGKLLEKFIDKIDENLLRIVNFKFYHILSTSNDHNIILKVCQIHPNIILYFLVKNNNIDMIKFLSKNINLNFIDKSYSTLLNLSIKYDRYEIIKNIIQFFEVDKPYHFYDKRSLNMAFEYGNVDIIKMVIIKAINDNIDFNLFDNKKNTFLHNFLLMKKKKILELINEMVLLIKNTNLNFDNYHGITCAQIIFDMKLFMIDNVYEVLLNKDIDFGKKNYLDENIFIISENFTTNERKKYENLLKNFKMKIKDISFNFDIEFHNVEYGLFRSNTFDYMIYLDYLIKKYDLKVLINDKIYNYDFHFYRLTDGDEIFRNDMKIYKTYFPKFFDHTIRWMNKNKYYLAKNYHQLDIIKDSVYLFKITHIGNEIKHANVLLYDNKYKCAYRFEPYGISNMGNDGNVMDNILMELLEKQFGKIQYFDPDKFLYGLNFQLIDGEDNDYMTVKGDPKGYCLAWSLWFVQFYMQNRNYSEKFIEKLRAFMNRNVLVEKFKKMNYKSINYYLDFIRSYGNYLNKVKNDKYEYIGIEDNKYLNSMTDEMISKVIKYIDEEY